MASVGAWLEVLSYIKAFVDASTLSVDFRKAYQRHRAEPETQAAARLASARYSTYSDDELEAISQRLQNSRGLSNSKPACHPSALLNPAVWLTASRFPALSLQNGFPLPQEGRIALKRLFMESAI
jgi:hypothetical protein